MQLHLWDVFSKECCQIGFLESSLHGNIPGNSTNNIQPRQSSRPECKERLFAEERPKGVLCFGSSNLEASLKLYDVLHVYRFGYRHSAECKESTNSFILSTQTVSQAITCKSPIIAFEHFFN